MIETGRNPKRKRKVVDEDRFAPPHTGVLDKAARYAEYFRPTSFSSSCQRSCGCRVIHHQERLASRCSVPDETTNNLDRRAEKLGIDLVDIRTEKDEDEFIADCGIELNFVSRAYLRPYFYKAAVQSSVLFASETFYCNHTTMIKKLESFHTIADRKTHRRRRRSLDPSLDY